MANKNNNEILDKALTVFKSASENVEAYKKFLKKNKISAKDILKNKNFEAIPVMNKANYLLSYKLRELVPFSKFPPMISASSGSSGKPYYWPRGDEQEIRGAQIHKVILEDIFNIKKKKTLAIVCFSMGNWIAGTFTLSSLREVSRNKNLNLSIITPGIDKDDVVQVLKNFAGNFESVIMFGYPPFLMDVILEAKNLKINLKKLNIHFVFAGENFSEKWRDIIFKNTGVPTGELNRSASIYGTADAGAIGHENPFTVLVRRLTEKNIKFKKELLGDINFTPTIVSYDPKKIYFETINGELVFTTNSGIPLVRYNIKDHGVLFSKNDVLLIMKKHGLLKYSENFKKWKNPIIVLKGRNDVSVTFYGLNIYPENLAAGLENMKSLDFITGKYVAKVEQVKNFKEQKLKIAVELKPKILANKEIKELITNTILENLLKLNTEYRKLFNSIHKKAIPEITLVKNGHNQFIIKKSKHKWIQVNKK